MDLFAYVVGIFVGYAIGTRVEFYRAQKFIFDVEIFAKHVGVDLNTTNLIKVWNSYREQNPSLPLLIKRRLKRIFRSLGRA